MGANSEYFLILQESHFNNLSNEERDRFSYIEFRESNEWETHKDDPNYLKLKKSEKKAKKDLHEYLFNKRHK